MADEFVATFNPGVVNKPSDTVTIVFSSPTNADPVVMKLFEADTWDTGSGPVVEGDGKNDLIAEFTGKVVAGKFKVSNVKKSPAPTGAPVINIQIDGDSTVHALSVPSDPGEEENGLLELQVQITGTISGTEKKFTNKTPCFIRNFKTNKPVIAIIAGQDDPSTPADQPFAEAKKFWSQNADGVFEILNVEEILKFLNTAGAARGFPTWHEVNIVAHGNEFGWHLQMFAANADPDQIDLDELGTHGADTRLTANKPTGKWDSDAKLVLRGCEVGLDQPLLVKLRDLFGGPSKIFAPKMILQYEHSGTVSRETLIEFFYMYSPGATVPSDAVCRAKLKAQGRPVPATLTDAEWDAMLKDTTNRLDSTETIQMKKEYAAKPAPGFDFKNDMKSMYVKGDGNLQANFDDWDWKVKSGPTPTAGGRFEVVLEGTLTRVRVRRQLVDAQKKPVVPDLSNAKHFGQAP